jgi:hypothetical protein
MNKKTISLSGPPLKKSSSPFRWARQKSDNRPPKKPLSSYNIYFLLERERIVSGDNNNTLRIYTLEDVQNIVKLQKWNHNHRKRQHRKTHGKISFHDLSRVVAENWRNLDETYKDVFNQQAAIEKSIYKKEMDQWIIKQMNQNHYNNTTDTNSLNNRIKKHDIDNSNTGSHTNNMSEVIKNNDDNDEVKQLSNQEIFHMLQYFDIITNDDAIEEKVVSNTMQHIGTSYSHTNTTSHNYNNHNETNNMDDLYNWKIDINGPLWYNNAKNCSEEFALQMIDAMHHSNNNSFSSFDRAITL